MAAFFYKAVNIKGKASQGVIEAVSAISARQILRDRELLPLSVEATKAKAKSATKSWSNVNLFKPGGLGHRQLTLFTRQLATLLSSDVRVEDALQTLAKQAHGRRGQAAQSLMLNLRANIMEGQSFAAALADYPATFGSFYRASVKAGEASGTLDKVMEKLAEHIENQSANRQSVQLALIYPALLFVVSLGIIVALLTFVVPDIVRVFTARGTQLPFLTRALIGLSSFVSTYGLAILLTLSVAFVAGARALAHPPVRLRYHTFLARFPLTRSFSVRIGTAQFSGTLATLTISQVPLVDALSAAAETVDNLYIKSRVALVAEKVREGTALAASLSQAEVFPPLLIAMVASGERSGKLGESLLRAAADQSREVDAIVKSLVALVEPGVLLLMGGVVMLLVLAILMPIINLNALVG